MEAGSREGPALRAPIRSYRDLEVYQRSREALKLVHELVKRFPDHEKYDLADQMRRASKSISANIVEGFALRDSVKEFKRYLRIAMASANEMEAHIEVALDLSYISAVDAKPLLDQYRVIGKQLHRLIENWRSFK
jgi:four helix bundle protein